MTSASESLPESERRRAASSPPPRLSLSGLLQRYGRAICQDPPRCAGLIRDLCEGSYRDHFLWTAALQEGAVAELLAGAPDLPRDLRLSGLAGKLAERLGLAPEAAAWAVRSWAAALEGAPEWTAESEPAPLPTGFAGDTDAPPPSGRGWLLWCGTAILSSLLALSTVAWSTLRFEVSSVGPWMAGSGLLASGCLAAWLGLAWSGKHLRALDRPDWSGLPPARSAAAVVPELVVVLLTPLVPVGTVALWAGACWAEWPDTSGSVFLAWLLARVFQGLLLATLVAGWLPAMLRTERRLVMGWREHP